MYRYIFLTDYRSLVEALEAVQALEMDGWHCLERSCCGWTMVKP